MHRIDTAGHQGNKFVDADPAQGIAGTVVNDEWLNSVQEEISNLIESSGDELDKAKKDQLSVTVNKLIADMGRQRVIRVTTVDDLASIPLGISVDGAAARIATTDRAGDFTFRSADLSAEVAADPQRGIYVPPNGQDGSSGAWVRDISAGFVTPEMFGAIGDGETINTAAYNSLIASTPEGFTVKWGDPSGRYVGDFNSTKSFKCDVNNATIIPVEGGYGVHMRSDSVQYSVIETELLPGIKSFTLSGVVNVEPGSLIMLWDNAVRSAGGDVNFEIFEVDSSSDDGANTTVFIVGEAEAHKGAGSIVAYHFAEPLESPSIINMRYENDNAAVSMPAFYIRGAKNPLMKNGYTKGSIGHAFRMQESINCRTRIVRGDRPLAIGSGQGYIATGFRCKNISLKHIWANGSRHAVDFSSCYGKVKAWHIKEIDANFSVVDFAHNGFGSGADIYDLEYHANGFVYGASSSSQGYNNAVRENHPTPNISIRKVRAYLNYKVDDFTHHAAYVRTDGDTLTVEDVRVFYAQEDAPTLTDSTYLRVDASFKKADVEKVSGNVVGRPFRMYSEGAYRSVVSLKGIDTGDAAARSLFLGCDLFIDGYLYGDTGLDTDAIEVGTVSGNTPLYLHARGVFPRQGADPVNPIKNNGVSLLLGYIEETSRQSSSSLDIADSDVLTPEQVFNRSSMLKANTGLGSGTVTATIPDPILYAGQKITISVLPARNTLELTEGNTAELISISEGTSAVLISDVNIWRRMI